MVLNPRNLTTAQEDPGVVPLTGSELVRIVQSGLNKKITTHDIGSGFLTAPNVWTAPTRAEATATVIPSNVTSVVTEGLAVVGDGGGLSYSKTTGTTPGGFQSADGQWWKVIQPNTPYTTRAVATAANVPPLYPYLLTEGLSAVGDGGGLLYFRVGGSTANGFQSADGQWWQAVPSQLFAARADAVAAHIPSTYSYVRTFGYYAVGDGGGTVYAKTGGTSPGGFQSADGQWWKLTDTVANAKQFGVVGDGVADDYPAFHTWAEYALTLPAPQTLIIPPGNYHLSFSGRILQDANGNALSHATVYAYGANFIDNLAIINQSIVFGDNTGQYRINAARAGQASVTCTTPADAANFAPNTWAWISGLDLQGTGFPPNDYYNEFVYITGVNAGTGVISFNQALRHTYKSTWPLYNNGTPSSSQGQGGPATIWKLDPRWDADITIYGLTYSGGIDVNNTFINISGIRKLTTIDCSFTGISANGAAPAPSMSKEVVLQRCYFASQIENDKGVEVLRYIDCRMDKRLLTQSTSIDLMEIDGCIWSRTGGTLNPGGLGGADGGIQGTARNTVIRNSIAPALTVGASAFGLAFGPTENLLVENSRINAVIGTLADGTGSPDLISNWTLSHGVLSRAKASGPAWWAVPGAAMFMVLHTNQPEDNHGIPFRVLSVTDDGVNTLVTTTLGNSLPGVVDRFQIHPCPKVTFRNVTGCHRAEMLSQQKPGAPFLSYAQRTYIGALTGTETPPQPFVWGTIVLFKIKVAQAYTGTLSGLTLIVTAIGVDTAMSNHTMTLVIDLKTASERSITSTTASTGLTFSGATNALTPAGNATLHFAATPAHVAKGMLVVNTAGASITAGTRVLSITGTTVVMDTNAAGNINNGDTIQFSEDLQPFPYWLGTGGISMVYSGDISGETIDLSPIVAVEVTTDQGVTNYDNIRVSGADIINGTTANTPAEAF